MEFEQAEPTVENLFNELIEKDIKFMGVTARPLRSAPITQRQLLKAKVPLDSSSIINKELILDSYTGFIKNVLYVGSSGEKGDSLLSFWTEINFKPEKILFIDNSRSNLRKRA